MTNSKKLAALSLMVLFVAAPFTLLAQSTNAHQNRIVGVWDVQVMLGADVASAAGAGGPAENEAGAAGVLRSINTAQVIYVKTYQQGFACDLKHFGPPPAGEEPSAQHADFLDNTVRSDKPRKGYVLSLACIGEQPPYKSYRVAAVPEKPGESGKRAFCSDEAGEVVAAEDGKAETCFQNLTRKKAPAENQSLR